MKRKEFVKLYNQLASKIYRFVYLKTGSARDSEDLTSEAFFKFWQNIKDSTTGIANPRALLYRIASNLVIDLYRKKNKEPLVLDPTDCVLTQIKDENNLGKELDIDLDMEQLKQALAGLKHDYQDIIIWHYLDDFSVKEIAQILERPESSIRVLLHRSLKKLKKVISFKDCP